MSKKFKEITEIKENTLDTVPQIEDFQYADFSQESCYVNSTDKIVPTANLRDITIREVLPTVQFTISNYEDFGNEGVLDYDTSYNDNTHANDGDGNDVNVWIDSFPDESVITPMAEKIENFDEDTQSRNIQKVSRKRSKMCEDDTDMKLSEMAPIKMVRKMNKLAKRLAATSKSRRPEPESDSEGSDFDFDNAIPENEDKHVPMEGIESGQESDPDEEKELQAAFAAGILKSDGLNVIVPKKRPVINKTAEMKEKLNEFKKDLPWVETLEVVTPHIQMDKEAENDDFKRELNFYKQAEKAVQIAFPRLLNMNIKVLRPGDYYAEMAKSDSHMQKVRKRLLSIQEMKERQEAFRRLREEKKFAVKVQKEAIAAKNSEKKKLAEAVKKHKKGMKQQLEDMLNNVKRNGLDQDDDIGRGARGHRGGMRGGSKGSLRNVGDLKRKLKQDKFGYGGKKKGMKRNNKESFDDLFGGRKGGVGGGRFDKPAQCIRYKMVWFLFMVFSAVFVFVVLLISTCIPYTFLKNCCLGTSKFTVSLLGCASCGLFIATCFLGLIPHVRHQEMQLKSNSTITENYPILPTTDQLVVIGFLVILITEQIIHGIGHSIGHSHSSHTHLHQQTNIKMRKFLDEESGDDAEPLVEVDATVEDEHDDIIFRQSSTSHVDRDSSGSSSSQNLQSMDVRVWFLLLGMSVHSFFEGVALGVQNDASAFYQIIFAIMFHEVLCCVSFGIQLAKHNASRVYAWTSSIFLSATIPLGMILATTIDGVGNEAWQKIGRYWLEGLAAGTFVHVSLVELLPMELHSEDGGHGHSHSVIADSSTPSSQSHVKWNSLIKSLFVAAGVGTFVTIKAIMGGGH
ncbi:unnamed protein product [Caenorhabditis bovis]|uniref:Uncharacterized protein n=1 Tax=Caenorhabditis bovis TaxID=2654633 RepID=A0A8S1EU85_9PELO|nr:unnamed protein product [Caenorhabditis bovis]